MCDEWRNSFETFVKDMGPCPVRMSIERKDNHLGYFPGNCRWATRNEQARNKRNNRMITVNGETCCLAVWTERMKIRPGLIHIRLRDGWTPEEAVLTPVRYTKRAFVAT